VLTLILGAATTLYFIVATMAKIKNGTSKIEHNSKLIAIQEATTVWIGKRVIITCTFIPAIRG
jgi:hypothetical protein